MFTNRFLAGCGALSLSLSLLVGCTSPAAVPTATESTTPVTVADTPAAQPTAQPAAPAAVAPTTLDGKVIFKGQPVAGYAVTVYDARTNLPVERKADLASATGLAVLDQSLVTDAQGGFKLQVIGLAPGQALRVVASKGKTSFEAIVSSELQTLGAKQRRVLATGATLTLSELTTALAKIARNVVLTTQVLTPEAAAPVLAKLMADMETLSAKLDEQLKQLPAMADELTQAESADTIGKAEASALNVLINNAGLLKETTKVVAELIAEIAKQSKDPASRSTAAADPKLVEALAKVEYVGTVLTGALDGTNGTISLFNSITGGKVNPSTGIGTIADRVTPNRRSDRPAPPVENIAYVATEQELSDAVADTTITKIVLTAAITISPYTNFTISRPVTIDGGDGNVSIGTDDYGSLEVGSAVTLKNMHLNLIVSVDNGDDVTGATFDSVMFSGTPIPATALIVQAGNKATFTGCEFTGTFVNGVDVSGKIDVSNCTFGTAISTGIYIHPGTAPAPRITQCTFNSRGGVEFLSPNIPASAVGEISGNTFNAQNGSSIGVAFAAISAEANTIMSNLRASNDFNDYSFTNEAYWKNGL